MVAVSLVIPAFNEHDRIVDCLTNATRQSVPAHEIIVVDNRSTDDTVALVEQFIAQHPQAKVRLLRQDAEQGLIPTRNMGLNAATGDVVGRVDADCMLKPDWVEVVAKVFADDPRAMAATGPVSYYDMPARQASLRGDDRVRRRTYRVDNGQVLLFGSNMALRTIAWQAIAHDVCRDEEDVMHEDIDVSLHLLARGMKTVYCPNMICGISARRMHSSPSSFHSYMNRFKNTFDAHPDHRRTHKSERTLYAMYPALHVLYPIYQKLLEARDINPAERVWFEEQKALAQRDGVMFD